VRSVRCSCFGAQRAPHCRLPGISLVRASPDATLKRARLHPPVGLVFRLPVKSKVSVPNLHRLRRLSHPSSRLHPIKVTGGCLEIAWVRRHHALTHTFGRPRWRRRREEHKHSARREAEDTPEFPGFRKPSLRFAHLGYIRRGARACECCAFHGLLDWTPNGSVLYKCPRAWRAAMAASLRGKQKSGKARSRECT
jgi:hypothetical protein